MLLPLENLIVVCHMTALKLMAQSQQNNSCETIAYIIEVAAAVFTSLRTSHTTLALELVYEYIWQIVYPR
jgi:hypothetical protein